MANRIKGITIEIGGDTTKLDKALSATDSQLKKTQANLKDVNKLLKMDPGNTELLAQKQRLLAEAVSGTRERLDTLKKAAADADAALARGNAYTAKYGELDAELAKVSASFKDLQAKKKDLDTALSVGEISAEEYAKFDKQLQTTGQELKELRARKREADKEFEGTKLDQSQYDALQRELIEAGEAYKSAEKAAKSFNVSAAEIEAVAGKVSSGAGKIADATKGISAAAGVAAAGLVGMAAKAGLAADDLNTLAKQTGFDTATLQEWTYAADLIDVSVEDIVSAVRKMKKNMTSTSTDVQNAWQQLGMSLYDSSGQLRDVDSVFYDLIGNLSLIENETERDTLAMTLFGKGADELAGIIDDGGAVLRALGQEAQDAGLILSQDALDGANAFNDGLDRIKAQAQAAFMESGAALAENLLPVLEEAVAGIGSLLQWLGSLDGSTLQLLLNVLLAVAGISPVAGMISNIAGGLSSVFGLVGKISGALGGLGGAAGAAGAAVDGISSAAGGLTGSFGGALQAVGAFFTGPAGLIALAAAAAIGLTILYDNNEEFRAALESFDQWLTGIFSTDWTETFGAAGEVLNVFFANASNLYEGIKQTLGGVIDFIGGVFSGDWERAWQGVLDIFGGIWSLLESVIKSPINVAIGLINSFLQFVTDGINSLIGLLNSFSVDVPDWVPGIGGESLGFSIPTLTAPSIPYLAEGAFLRRNNPMLAVVGDNKREDEIIAPRSAIIEAVKAANAGSSAAVPKITILFGGDLAALTRFFRTQIKYEDNRLGPSQART